MRLPVAGRSPAHLRGFLNPSQDTKRNAAFGYNLQDLTRNDNDHLSRDRICFARKGTSGTIGKRAARRLTASACARA